MNIRNTPLRLWNAQTFNILLSTYSKSILIAVIYQLDKLNFLTFIEDLAEYIETVITLSAELMLFGDFIIHVNDLYNPNQVHFKIS